MLETNSATVTDFSNSVFFWEQQKQTFTTAAVNFKKMTNIKMNKLLEKKVEEKDRRFKSLQTARRLLEDHTGNTTYMCTNSKERF